MGRLVLLILIAFSASAQSGTWGQRGISRAFAIDGEVLYAADGRGVAVYDVSADDRITRLDVEWGDDETYDVALFGETDLVVGTSTGVERFAVAEDGTLARLSATTGPGPTQHIAANAVYVAAASAKKVTLLERNGIGLKVAQRIFHSGDVTALAFVGDSLYVSVDRQPTRVYHAPSSTATDLLPGITASQFALSGDVLWAASEGDGLTAIDVRNPAIPTVLGNIGRNVLRLGGVAASGTRVYAFESPNRLHVFDASDAEEIELVATKSEWINVIGASDTRVFFAGPVVDDPGLAYDPGLIARELGKPVRAVDAFTLAIVAEYEELGACAVERAVPLATTLQGGLANQRSRPCRLAGPVSGVWTDGSVAYVVDPPYLRVLDVSTTANPSEVASLLLPNLQDRIRVKNGLAVIYGRAFVNLVDVSSPLRPRLIATWDAQGHPPSAAAILQTRVLEANEHSGMHVVDFSDPAFPVQIGGRVWHYRDVAASDDAAYALQHDLMLVVEIADERTVIDRDAIHDVHAQIDTVPPNASRPGFLLARAENGLRLYSLADRFHPVEVGFLPMTGLGVFAAGNGDAYVAKDGRLHLVDLAKPLALQATEMRVTSPMQMSVAGRKIVIADRYSVRVYGPDTAPPPRPPSRRRPTRH